LIQRDLGLSYAEIGLVLAIPGFVGNALEPFLGVLADTRRRATLLATGGFAFALSAGLTAAATGFWPLLLALVIGNPATTAFVSVSQAALMDSAPAERERNMARWTLAGSVGVVAGPMALAAALTAGAGWRGAMLALAVAAVPLAGLGRRVVRPGTAAARLRAGLSGAAAALRQPDVLRWLAVLAGADLMLDVLHGFLALYFVDVVGITPTRAALALTVWTVASLVGDALLLVVLRRVRGTRYLRASAWVTTLVFPTFLLVPGVGLKLCALAVLGLLNSGWYAIPKAGLYRALPGQSGTAIAVGSVKGWLGALVLLGLGFSAETVGLAATMWLLLAAPVALLALVPKRQ
jgi:MFS transporter, FSR family, fosmidomycin resistance protein